MSENNTEEEKIENIPSFSWAYALWGVFGFFFHRINIEKHSFWKSAGIDIFCWMIVIGLFMKFLGVVFPGLYASIALFILQTMFCGYIGAWRFNKFKKKDWNIATWKRREKIGIVSGVIMIAVLMLL